jgi:lipopolysaccharide transport system permease protein
MNKGNHVEKLPVTILEPPGRLFSIDFGELWRFRELFLFLVWRDIKVRYKQTVLGISWAVIGPLATAFIFTFLFGKVGNLPDDGLPKPLFYMAGLVIWRYFSTSLTTAGNSLVGNEALLTKIYMPRLIIPSSSIITSLVDFAVGLVCLLLLMVCFRVDGQVVFPAATSLLIPVLLLITMMTALGLGLILCSLNVKYRDIRHIIPLMVQLWMYCTVIVPFSKLPDWLGNWKWLYGLNPMAGVVEGFRWCLLHPHMKNTRDVPRVIESREANQYMASGHEVLTSMENGNVIHRFTETVMLDPVNPWPLLALGFLVAGILLTSGLVYFHKTERLFADVI